MKLCPYHFREYNSLNIYFLIGLRLKTKILKVKYYLDSVILQFHFSSVFLQVPNIYFQDFFYIPKVAMNFVTLSPCPGYFLCQEYPYPSTHCLTNPYTFVRSQPHFNLFKGVFSETLKSSDYTMTSFLQSNYSSVIIY